jgi:hypothetical protein
VDELGLVIVTEAEIGVGTVVQVGMEIDIANALEDQVETGTGKLAKIASE